MRDSRPLSGWILVGAAVLAVTTQLSGCGRGLAVPAPEPEPEPAVVAPGAHPAKAVTTARGPSTDRYHLTPVVHPWAGVPEAFARGPVLVDPLWHARPAPTAEVLRA